MFALALLACHSDDLDAARDRVDGFLEAHPHGSAIVQVEVGGPALVGSVGELWEGRSLRDALADCGLSDAGVDVELVLAPGSFPWEVRSATETEAERCVGGALSRFPFTEPLRRGASDLVHVRWRPAEKVDEHTVHEGPEPSGLPLGLRALAPPYYRAAPDGDALVRGEDLDVDDGRVRLRVTDADVHAGTLDDVEAWARKLTCPADERTLVRTALVFEDGALELRDTWPETECVEDAARAASSWMRERPIGGERIADAGNVLVVLDVPVGAW